MPSHGFSLSVAFSRKTNEFRALEDLLFIGAMGPPGGGKNHIPARYMWHYNVMYITPYAAESLNRIFTTIMKWFFMPFPSSVPVSLALRVLSSVRLSASASSLLSVGLSGNFTGNQGR